jgi:hypothetical protein
MRRHRPLMPEQEQLDDFLEALERCGSPVRNPVLRQALGWEEGSYDAVKAELVARRIVVRGRGAATEGKDKSLETWIWDAACSIRGAKDAAKYKDYILPLFFTKRLCDVFDDELNRIAEQVGSRAKAFQLVQLALPLSAKRWGRATKAQTCSFAANRE